MKIKILKNKVMNNESLVLQLNLPDQKFVAVPIGDCFEVPDETGYALLGDKRYQGCLEKLNEDSEEKAKVVYENKSMTGKSVRDKSGRFGGKPEGAETSAA